MIHFRPPDDGDKVGIAAVRMDRRSSDEVAESKDGRLFTRYSTALCSVLSLVHASQAEHCRRKNRPAIAATKSRRVKMDGGCLSTNKQPSLGGGGTSDAKERTITKRTQ